MLDIVATFFLRKRAQILDVTHYREQPRSCNGKRPCLRKLWVWVKPKTIKIGIYCFSAMKAILRRKSQYGLARNGSTRLPEDCCFSELAVKNSTNASWSSTKWTSLSSNRNVACSRHIIT